MKSNLKNKDVVLIGGSSYDIVAAFRGKVNLEDSNPSDIYAGCGGAGRNIAENMARMGLSVGIITALGDDRTSDILIESLDMAGIEWKASYIKKNSGASTYISFLDSEGELILAASDFDLIENIPKEKIDDMVDYCKDFKYVFLDANLSSYTLEKIAKNFSGKIFCDAVSIAKANRFEPILEHIHTLKTNRAELETLAGFTLETEEDVLRAIERLISKGVRRVFVTFGEKGSCCVDENEIIFIDVIRTKVRNVTGAGDTFSAAIATGTLREMNNLETLILATAAAQMNLEDPQSVCRDINPERLMQRYTKIKEIAKVKRILKRREQ